jgi:predicted transport protein/predicted type IV restriction endonuclease
MAVYQDKAKERIKKSLRKFKPIAAKQRTDTVNESDTRLLVSAVLSEALGWDPFTNLTGEHMIKGQYCDIEIKQASGPFAIVEVKAAAIPLSPKHLYQAVGYAASEGIDWVVLTNGSDWQVYRVVFAKPVNQDLVFEASLLDEETPPARKAELLYLLSAEAQRSGELDAYYEKKAALCGTNIAKALLGQKMLNTLRLEMRRLHGHNVSPQELATMLVSEVFRPDVQGDETAQLILKAAAQKRKAANGSGKSGHSPQAVPQPEYHLSKAQGELRGIADELFAYVAGLGSDVTVKPMKSCIAFRTTRNFCCLDIYGKHLFLALDIDPALGDGCEFARDVRGVGHQGTGDLQLRVQGPEQLEAAKQLALLAYQTSLDA